MKFFSLFKSIPVSLLLILLLLVSCTKEDDLPGNEQNPTVQDVSYQDNVISLNQFKIDSVKVISDEELHAYTSTDIDYNSWVGKVVVYSDSITFTYFAGKVLAVHSISDCIVLNTEIPAMDEVFSQLRASAEFGTGNVRVDFVPDGEDNVKFCGVVGNEIWNTLPVVAIDDKSASPGKTQTKAAYGKVSTPIDITFKFEACGNNVFSGSIYYRIQGSVVMNKDCSYELSVNQIIGLDGSFKI